MYVRLCFLPDIYIGIVRLQVARVLHLINRLVVQPNTSRAQTFAEAFTSSGGIESLLVLLQREAKAGDNSSDPSVAKTTKLVVPISEQKNDDEVLEICHSVNIEETSLASEERAIETESVSKGSNPITIGVTSNIERMTSASEKSFAGNLGDINFSISGENARNNAYNVENGDGILVAIIGLLGALVISGHLKFNSNATPDVTGNPLGLLQEGGTMFDDKVSLLYFSLQKAFQAAPNRLMTSKVYTALLGASVCDFCSCFSKLCISCVSGKQMA